VKRRIHWSLIVGLLVWLWMLSPTPARGEERTAGPEFEKRTFKGEGGLTLLYRLVRPVENPKADAKATKHPLLVLLHGAGERGDDNEAQLKWGKEYMISAAKAGCYVIAPQCPKEQTWAAFRLPADGSEPKQTEPNKLVIELVAAAQKEFADIDSSRLYLTGLSMGGYGTWDIIQRQPDTFAAAIPICGGGNTAKAERMKSTPIWAFHGDKDQAVPVDLSRKMVDAVKKAGGTVKYTEYPGVDHNSWSKAYADPELLKWMLEQRREKK
jgi:predicted peptidase